MDVELADTRLEVMDQHGACILVCHVIGREKPDAIGYMPNRKFADFVAQLWNLAADQMRAKLKEEET